jgi:TatD DNase family protein
MKLTDTHAHLYAEQFDNDRESMMARAMQQGVEYFFLPNIDSASIEGMLALVKKYPGKCFPMMGLHPCYVAKTYEDDLEVVTGWLKKMKSEPEAPRFYAVGEIGIDLYWDKTHFKEQQEAFRRQITLAKEYGLPIVIHTRSSFDEAFEIVREMHEGTLKGIFHCFSGTLEQAKQVIALGGFKLGIGGVVTFKNSGVDKVVEGVSLEHLVLETDAPYLAPVPYRGKRNESAYVRLVAEKVAQIKNIPVEEVARITTENALRLFGISS